MIFLARHGKIEGHILRNKWKEGYFKRMNQILKNEQLDKKHSDEKYSNNIYSDEKYSNEKYSNKTYSNEINDTEHNYDVMAKENSKDQIMKELEKQGCVRLKELVENGIVSPDDTINLFPLCRVAERHLKLRESIYREEDSNKKSFEQSSAEILNDVVLLLKELYPGVEINNISMRQKSEKSFLTKIKGLEIERISKMFAIESDVINYDTMQNDGINNAKSEKDVDYRINLIKKIESSLKSYLLTQVKRIDEEDTNLIMMKKTDEIQQREEMLKVLLKERIDENIVNIEGDVAEIQERDSFIEQLNNLIDGNCIDFQKTAEMFLDEPRFSKSTKNAIARLIYSKINTNAKMLYTDLNGNTAEKYILPEERRKIRREFKKQYEEQLNYASIERIEDSAQEGNGMFFDERYTSEMDRLMDPNEFLRCRDMYGMHIIVKDFDANIKTNNQKIDNNLKNRSKLEKKETEKYGNSDRNEDTVKNNNSEKYKDSEEYKAYTQSCVDILGSNFVSRLKGEGINTTYLRDNPQINKIWKELSDRAKIIEVKYKDKTNGYKATHIKLQIDNNPDYILEAQVKSDYVYEKSKGNGPAAHHNRIGKQRIVPEIIERDNVNLSNLNEEQVERLKNEFDYYLPQYYKIVYDEKSEQYKTIRCNTMENCERFYEDFKIQGRQKDVELYKRIVLAAQRYAGGNEIEIPISKGQEQNKDLVNCVRAENEDSTEKDTRVENNFNGESTKKINSDLER